MSGIEQYRIPSSARKENAARWVEKIRLQGPSVGRDWKRVMTANGDRG
jgi:hypothetical protein